MAELIYEDVFYNSYQIDGEGNLNEIIADIDLLKLEPYLNIAREKIENYTEIKPESTLIEAYGGKMDYQSENNITKKYNSIEQLLEDIKRRQEILVSGLSSKLAYLDLKPRYSIISERVSKTGLGYISYKTTRSDEIFNQVLINKEIPYYDNIDERIAPEAGTFFNVTMKPKGFTSNFEVNEESKQHVVVLFRWNDNPTEITKDVKSVIVGDFINNDFAKKIGKRDDGKNESPSLSSTSDVVEDTTDLINLGRINYYLLYDMKSEKFYLTLRGTNFGNRTDDVGDYLSSGLSNITLDLQIAIDKVINIYDTTTLPTEERTILLHNLRNYLASIVYNLLKELKTIITYKIIEEEEQFNTCIDYIIHIIFGTEFKKKFYAFIEHLIVLSKDVSLEELTTMINTFSQLLLDKIFLNHFFASYMTIVSKRKKQTIRSISKLIHLCISKNYLEFTKIYSCYIVNQAIHIIRFFGRKDDDLIICGHSLGGGLTQFLCSLYNKRGYTFNPIGGKILRDDITLNLDKPIEEFISPLKIQTKSGRILPFILKKFAHLATSYLINSATLGLKITFPSFNLSYIELSSDVSNIVVSQDIIHKILLSYDNNQHFGNLYMCSIEKYLDFYTQSYLFNTNLVQFSNITMFHSIDGLLILLNKILNNKKYRIKYVNPAILQFTKVIAKNNKEYCSYRENFIYYSNDITNLSEYAIGHTDAASSRDELSIKYYKKYLKYKQKYLNLKK
jgi:hypothetical protein